MHASDPLEQTLYYQTHNKRKLYFNLIVLSRKKKKKTSRKAHCAYLARQTLRVHVRLLSFCHLQAEITSTVSACGANRIRQATRQEHQASSTIRQPSGFDPSLGCTCSFVTPFFPDAPSKEDISRDEIATVPSAFYSYYVILTMVGVCANRMVFKMPRFCTT